MRTPLLVTVLGLSLAGCLTIGDSGPGSPGGDDMGTGSNTGSGTGLGSNNGSGTTANVSVAVDRPTVATELGKSEIVTLTLTSMGSFTGNVTVASSLVDGAGAALATGGLTVTGPASVTLAAGGTATAMYTVKIPTNATGTQMLANLKLDVSSSVGSKAFTSAFTIAANYTITYAAGLGTTAANHPVQNTTPITVKKGAKISVHNADTIPHRTHGAGAIPHEAGNGPVGGTYVVDTATVTGTSGVIGCHDHQTGSEYAPVTIE